MLIVFAAVLNRDEKTVVGVPFDSPILGYRVNTVNTLRLWRAEATEAFDFTVFNRGDYLGAVSKKVTSENLTKVLYPNDETQQGKELRPLLSSLRSIPGMRPSRHPATETTPCPPSC